MRATDIAIPTTSTRWSTANRPVVRPTPRFPRHPPDRRRPLCRRLPMVNWKSNVFPGIPRPHLRPSLRTGLPARPRGGEQRRGADRRQARAGGDLPPGRVAADFKGRHPRAACRGRPRRRTASASPASAPAGLFTVARDLAPLGYSVTVFEAEAKGGGFMRTQVPRFRLPEAVIDEETGYILDLGVDFRGGTRIESMKALLAQGYDAVFVGRRRAARPGTARPRRSCRRHPHRHRLAGLGRSATSPRWAAA